MRLNPTTLPFFAVLAAAFLLMPLNAVALSRNDAVPEPAVKKLALTKEESISTYIPSEAAPGTGIAVNIVYPERPRYKEGAPVMVLVPAHRAGMAFSMHAAQAGLIEVRFSFPGTGLKNFTSGGIADNYGPVSQKALRDVILFASGKLQDVKGRAIAELVPVPVVPQTVGVVGWSTGGNIVLVTLAKFASELQCVRWLAFYESSVGSMLHPQNLGSDQDMWLNKHYRQGSAATGKILVDYRRLAFAPTQVRHPGLAKRRGEPEIKGVVYFDENANGEWDESYEFAFNYATEVGLEQQIYPPDVTEALTRLKVFGPPQKPQLPGKPRDGKPVIEATAPAGSNNDRDPVLPAAKPKGKIKMPQWKPKKGAPGDYQAVMRDQDGNMFEVPGGALSGLDGLLGNKPSSRQSQAAAAPLKPGVRGPIPWPKTVASLATSEAYFKERDGSLYLKQLTELYPHVLVTIFASRLDHLQRQPDHPNITLLYNGLIENRIGWIRLNPEPAYLSTMYDMHIENFKGNKPNAALDASEISEFLEPEGMLPDYALMTATVAELADRVKTGKLNSPLEKALVDYKMPQAITPQRTAAEN